MLCGMLLDNKTYKMVVKQLVLKKRSHYFFSSSVLLKDFDKTKLKIAQHDCVDRTVCHIDYAKNTINVNPLYLIIPEFYGSIERSKELGSAVENKVINI